MGDRHLHIVSFDIPYPPDNGGVIDVFYKLKAFSEAGIKVHLHCYEYGRSHADELKQYCETIHYYKRRTTRQYLFRARPYIVTSRNSTDLLDSLTSDDHPILFEGLHTCFYLDHKNLRHKKKIVRTHNIEHDYYMNLAKVEKEVFKRYYFYNEAAKLRLFEGVLKHANGLASISRKDTLYFSRKFKNVHFIPAFHPYQNVDIQEGKGDYILYHGNLSVGENNEAAMYLINKVFNDMENPLVIAGSRPSRELKEAVWKHKNITLKTNLTTEEIQDLISNAQVNILPTFQSTGIKLKLLAALYSGRHCIVNSFMIKNTGLTSLCKIANKPETMKQAVKELFEIPFDNQLFELRKKVLEKEYSNLVNIRRLLEILF